MGNVDLGPRNPYYYVRCEDIAEGLSIKRRFVLSYIYTSFAVPEPFVGNGLLRKITSEIEGFRVVKLREKTGPFPSNPSFVHSFRTSNFLVPLDSTKSFRFTRGRQIRRFQTLGLTISSYGRNRAHLRKSNIYHMTLSLSWPEGANVTNGFSHAGNRALRCYQRYRKGLFILHSYLHHMSPYC